jgi:hypothetical protein
METFFQGMGIALSSICGGQFEEAKISAEVFEEYVNTIYSCKKNGVYVDGVDYNPKDHFVVLDNLVAINEAMGRQWSKCTFVLMDDGNFSFEVD